VSDCVLAAADLVDLRRGDRWVGRVVDVGHTSTNHTAANEAHDADDLANPGQVLTVVFVEHVDRTRLVLRDKRYVERLRLSHNGTMAICGKVAEQAQGKGRATRLPSVRPPLRATLPMSRAPSQALAAECPRALPLPDAQVIPPTQTDRNPPVRRDLVPDAGASGNA
jgi:hypothetical protein